MRDKITPTKKIAIIGAGWAGLSAAVELAQHAQVTLFEASRVAGGRARGVSSDKFSFLDNGQHLLIGAYRGVFSLLEKLGVDRNSAFVRQPLQWYLVDGVQFQAAKNLPAPLNLLWAILMANNISLPEKFALLHQMSALQKWHAANSPDQSVLSWLDAQRVSEFWRQNFWQPMAWGALNTPLDTASLRVLCNVLADGVWAFREGSDYYLPKSDLTNLLAEPALRFLRENSGIWLPETRIEKIIHQNNKILINNEIFDTVILAVAPYHLEKLLPEHLGDSAREAIGTLNYQSITTVYLKYAQTFRLPALMTGFANGTAQWLIDRTQINGANEIAVVVSVSGEVSGCLNVKNDWAAKIHTDVLRICPEIGLPIAQQIITEKRATIASELGRTLPEMADLNAANIYLAGDWLYPRYPATLEAAVLSGKIAAQQILQK